ncbi:MULTISPECIES: helix-turn-helix transcriptional regulator [Streptomyces]|uniref:helix-turn-helix domain-containing protein n=1 Tax=Streptomyces TaxID=1883 RepID=UPI000F77C3E4|nr:helix-turn-helix transcriptional regulator [Streptomyces sp. WAC05858]RSS39431.1 XRE family transcriptional regulator [Streptomyces sp. WAC05858]WTA79302.1 helix-turn-helix transcriptional regulator [Streptomyces antimycoticus]
MDRDLDRLARIATERRLELGLARNKAAAEIGISKDTWKRLERGEPIREINYRKIDEALGWAAGSCVAVMEGSAPIPIEASNDDGVIAYVPVEGLQGELQDAVGMAALATTPDLTAREIKALSDQVVEELRKRGILPPTD